MTRIYEKLEVRNRVDLYALAVERLGEGIEMTDMDAHGWK